MAGELITRTNKVADLATSTQTLTINDNGGTFTNLGASGEVSFFLPAGCPVGLEFTFVVLVAEDLIVKLPAVGTGVGQKLIYDTQDFNGQFDYGLAASLIGSTCIILCLDNTLESEQFIVKSWTGVIPGGDVGPWKYSQPV